VQRRFGVKEKLDLVAKNLFHYRENFVTVPRHSLREVA
jgi:hypothetical protein